MKNRFALTGCLFVLAAAVPAQCETAGAYSHRSSRVIHHALRHRIGRVRRRVYPKIISVSPDAYQYSIPHAESGPYPTEVTLTVVGRGFRPGAVVTFDSRRVFTTVHSRTQLEAAVPFSLMERVAERDHRGFTSDGLQGSARIWVRNPGPAARNSAARWFGVHTVPIE